LHFGYAGCFRPGPIGVCAGVENVNVDASGQPLARDYSCDDAAFGWHGGSPIRRQPMVSVDARHPRQLRERHLDDDAPHELFAPVLPIASAPRRRLFVSGGEFGNGGDTAEIFDPVSNTWTVLPSPTTVFPGVNFSDGSADVLPNGNVLIAPVYTPFKPFGSTVIFDVVSNTWSLGPTALSYKDEESWVKLPDASILTIDFSAPLPSDTSRH
jgi:hypothetical protein